MKAKLSLIGTGVAIVCMIGIAIYSTQKTKEADKLRTATQALIKKTTPGPATGEMANLSPDEQFKHYMSFERDMRRFLRDQEEMTPAERNRLAIDLMQRIDQREEKKHLSAGEGLKLKIALINATVSDENQQALQVAELIARYQARAERQQAAFLDAQQRDPRFQSYKAREAQIVAEVQAMRSFPSGMSRSEYLRQRLLEARAAIYYTPQSAEPIPLEQPPRR